MNIVLFAVAGAIAGGVAARFMRGNGFGLIADVIIGVVGGMAGGYLLHSSGAEIGGGLAGGVIVAFAAAVVLLLVVHMITGRRKGRSVWS